MCDTLHNIPTFSVPAFENLSLEEIKEMLKSRKPFLIRKYDIGLCSKLWTPEYISKKMGKTPVKVHVSANNKLDFINKNFSYKTLPLDELMNRISTKKKKDFFIDAEEVYYLRSLGPDSRGKETANFSRDFPELAEDLKIPKLFNEQDFFSAILRISSANVRLWTHYDIMDNILIQIKGKKKVLLWPPSEVDKLYLVGDKSQITEVEEPNREKYSKFLEAKRYQCFLEEGDIIYIPALWFHNVISLETSFSVNVFWKNLPHELYEKKDTYGNKDLTVANRALCTLENGVKLLDPLPDEYKIFYIKRMINKLEEKLKYLE